MDKILVVARTEFGNAVRTKAFLVSLLLLPALYGIMILVQLYANKSDVAERKFAVIDRTGKLFPAIRKATEERNKLFVNAKGKATAPPFVAEEYKDGGKSPEETVLALSDRVRSGELFAFVEIPADAVEPKLAQPVSLKYYSNTPTYRDLQGYLDVVVGMASRVFRYQAVGINPVMAMQVDRPTVTETLGLATRGAPPPAAGAPATAPGAAPAIVAAQKIDPIRTIGLPIGVMMVIWIVTMTQPQQLVSTVMEEKMSRISEMLLGSLSPFELMAGKLLGSLATAMLTTALYLTAAYFAVGRMGYGDAITPKLVATLVLFITLSIVLFGSLFMAVGSACSELKDAQSLIMPVMMLAMLPMLVLGPVLMNPGGNLAVVLSLIPTATPILMPMRMVMSPAPPLWQVGLSVLITSLTALACVWASAKIFRTGLLMHGKAPSFRELARWVVAR